jgi:hypothetical protein
VDGLKVLYDTSQSENVSFDYFGSVRDAFKTKERVPHATMDYALTFINSRDYFAWTNYDSYYVAFSPTVLKYLRAPTIASYLVHERVHVESGPESSPHVVCTHGQSKGKGACDEFFYQDLNDDRMNAFSWQVLFLDDYLKTNAPKRMKKHARAMIKTLIENFFIRLPKYGRDGVTPFRRYYGLK